MVSQYVPAYLVPQTANRVQVDSDEYMLSIFDLARVLDPEHDGRLYDGFLAARLRGSAALDKFEAKCRREAEKQNLRVRKQRAGIGTGRRYRLVDWLTG